MRIHRILAVVVLALVLLPTAGFSSNPARARQSFPDCNWIPRFGELPQDRQWMPTFFHTEVGQYSGSTRYVLNLFSFSDTSGFGLGSTYEHDFSLNSQQASQGGNGASTYLARDERDDLPVYIRADSNLPNWYVDTRWGDDREIQLSFSIGALDADKIQPNTLYYTFFETEHGDADLDLGILDAQLGCQMPPGCVGMSPQWCSSGAVYKHLFQDWVIPVPGFCRSGPMPLDDTAIRQRLDIPPLNSAINPNTCFSGEINDRGEPSAVVAPQTPAPPTGEQGVIHAEVVEPTEPSSAGPVQAAPAEEPADAGNAQVIVPDQLGAGGDSGSASGTGDAPGPGSPGDIASEAPVSSGGVQYVDIGTSSDSQYIVSGMDAAVEDVAWLGPGWQCTLGGYDDWTHRQQLVGEDTLIRLPVTPGLEAMITLCVGKGAAPDRWSLSVESPTCSEYLGDDPQTEPRGGPTVSQPFRVPGYCTDSGMITLRFTNKSNYGAGIWGILIQQ